MKAEIPSAQVCEVAFEAVAGLTLINLSPNDGEISVPIDTNISLDIASVTASAPDPLSTSVLVNGDLAFLNGVFQPGYTGSTSTVGFQTLRIEIDPDDDLPIESVVEIRVQSEDVGNTAQLDVIYSFQTEDLSPPAITSATPRSRTSVEALFNESISDSALDISAWSVANVDAPAYRPAVIVVTRIAGDRFLISFDAELSFNRQYELVVQNVSDEFGNVLVEGRAAFTALDCERPARREFSLLAWFPSAARRADVTGDQAGLVAIWQEIFDLVLCDIDQFFARAIDPDTAEEQFLDLMLRDLRNPFSFEDLGVEKKRQLVLVLSTMYQLKGTAVGMEAAILFFTGIEATVDAFNETGTGLELGISELGVDWILGTGDTYLLYSFVIRVDEILAESDRTQITSIAIYMKPKWVHFLGIIEPESEVIEHMELGLSELGVNWLLH